MIFKMLVIGGLLMTVTAQPSCHTIANSEVVCTAGDQDYVLQRGLVSDNINTIKITLSKCRITELDYEAFEDDNNLQYIDLSQNKIQSLKLGVLDGNSKMTHLNISHNLLSTLPLGLLDQKQMLEVFDLKGNRINSLELGILDPLEKLSYLDLSSNALLGKDINVYLFDKSPKIKTIAFSRNDMTDTPENLLQAFTTLEFLSLDKCSLKDVPSFATKSNLRTLKHLILSSNHISKTDESRTFLNLDNLEILNMAENIIEELDSEVFSTLKKLKTVVLRGNRLKSLPGNLFTNLAMVGNVDLSYNLIEYVPVNAFRGTALKNLNLSHNRFTYLEANFCLELRNSGVRLNKFYFNDNPWQCACLNDALIEVKTYNIRYNSAKYNGEKSVCVTTKSFKCKRQIADNKIFVEMFDNKDT